MQAKRTMNIRDEISSRWKSRGFSCDLWVDPPGQVWEDYRHDVDELIYVLEGVLELEVAGKIKTLRTGDEGFIPARTNHTVRNIGGVEARWLYGYKRT